MAEIQKWSLILLRTGNFFAIYQAFVKSREFQERHRVKFAWSPGHFYSPIVDPETVVDYVRERQFARPADIHGIYFDEDAMFRFWQANKEFIRSTPFAKAAGTSARYSWGESPYPIGDAVTYRAMLHYLRPNRIVEVGSGFSTACALDTLDEIGLTDTLITCIEPFPAALQRRMKPSDSSRVEILESPVQAVPLSVFEQLSNGDILFIDSTHVLKTGSDVHFELFEVLPRLKPGVFVHFHDIRWPFEYPSDFTFKRNFSWNEAYALRAFLMYNPRFQVFFYNSLFATEQEALIRATFPDFLINAGSSIWLTVL